MKKKNLENQANEITLKQLLVHFSRERSDKRFCFILGAGASFQSGIPMADKLSKDWLEQIKESDGEDSLNKWMKENKVDKENTAKSYSLIYDKRFEIDSADGFDYLEKEMEEKEPSCGYSVLSQVLAETHHNVVITTNFDNLIAEALYMYTVKRPLICGHESLTGFIRPIMNRPLIAKVHRDILFAPKSSESETCELDKLWVMALSKIFDFYIPIVIGYGGNDGSLMGFLEKLEKINGGIFWCYREKSGKPEERIQKLVKKHSGYIIPIEGFDEMMIQLNSILGYELIDKKIISVANKRAKNYQKQIENIQKREKNPDTNLALNEMISKRVKDDDWWTITLKAEGEKNPIIKEDILKKGMKTFPKSAELILEYGNLFYEKEEFENAIEYYIKALNVDSNFHLAYYNWSLALYRMAYPMNIDENIYMQCIDKLNKTIDLEPNYTDALILKGVIIKHLAEIRKDEKLYLESIENFNKAIAINPDNVDSYDGKGTTLLSYASIKGESEKDIIFKETEKVLLKAEAIKEGRGSYNLACLWSIRKNKKVALKWFEKGLKLGNTERNHIDKDTDLDFIRNDKKFNELLDKYRPIKNIKKQ